MSVYTTLDNNDLSDFLAGFDVGIPVDLQGISDGIENTNYFVTTRHNNEKKEFVLTIFESLNHAELPFFLDLMAFLAERQVPCAHPIADRGGHYLQTLKSKPAALVQRLSGRSIEDPEPEHCRQVGSALAKMHVAGKDFAGKRDNPRGQDWIKQTAKQLIPAQGPAYLTSAEDRRLLQDEIAFQQKNIGSGQLPGGVIHADLFCDNVLFEHGILTGVIDFYYACSGSWLYDLAVTVNDWCSTDHGVLKTGHMQTLLQSYHRQRPLTEAEHAYWPLMLRAAALRFWLSRLLDLHFPRRGAITHTKNPDEFKHILLHHIHNQDSAQTLWI